MSWSNSIIYQTIAVLSFQIYYLNDHLCIIEHYLPDNKM